MPDAVVVFPEPGEWRDRLREWWRDRQQQHDPPRDDTPMPRPRLVILLDLATAMGIALPELLELPVPWTVARVMYQAAQLHWPVGSTEADAEQRISQALDQIGLTAFRDQSVWQLSASQRQQLAGVLRQLTGLVPFSPHTSHTIALTVWNHGHGPALACHVEVYEGPIGFTQPLPAYELRGAEVIRLMPGEWREVTLPWACRRTNARLVALCYDPLLDPIDFQVTLQQGSRHMLSFSYQ